MKINQLKAGAVLSYIFMGLGYSISIIYTPLMLRLLGQNEYGLYNLVASIVAYLGILNFGFGSAYIRYYSRHKSNNDFVNIAKINGMFLIVFSSIGLIAVLAGMILIFNTDAIFGTKLTSGELLTAKTLMAIMVFNIALSFPSIVFNSHITANEKFVFQKITQVVKVIVNPFLILPILFLGYGSVGMVIVSTVLNFIIEIINIMFCFKKLHIKFSFHGFDIVLMREMTVFSSFVFLHMVMNQVLWNVDKFILGRIWGTTTVAIYSLAAQLNMYYLSFSTAISNVFIPRVNNIVFSSDDINGNKELTDLLVRVGRLQFIIVSLILLGLIFFGRPFIFMWAGKNYIESYPIAMLLIIPVTFPLIQNLGIEILRAKNLQKFMAIINVFIALLNVFVSIPLAKMYGGVGSALGTAISLIIGNLLIANLYYHYKIGLNMKRFWLEIIRLLPGLIPPIILGIILFLFLDIYKLRYFIISIISFTITYFCAIWRFGMNKYEKDLIKIPIEHIRAKIKAKN